MGVFSEDSLTSSTIIGLTPRVLAHLGDSVLLLFEREREILNGSSVKQLHQKSSCRVSAVKQADFLDYITPKLNTSEQDIVRRGQNIKPSGYKKVGQNTYRKSTAFEALIGYLYLTNLVRLKEILSWTTEIP